MIPMFIDNESEAPNPYAASAEQLLATVRQYMSESEVELVAQAIQLAEETSSGVSEHREASLQSLRQLSPLVHALAVATVLAQLHIDAVGGAAGVVCVPVDAELLPLERVERTRGLPSGRVAGRVQRLNTLARAE